MASLEQTARDAVATWLGSLGLTGSPTISTEESAPGAPVALPTLTVRTPTSRWNVSQPEVVDDTGGRAIYDLGACEADVYFEHRSGSAAEAETFREEFRRDFLLAAMASDDATGDRPVLHIDATFLGLSEEVVLRLNPGDYIAEPNPGDTTSEDLWLVRHSGLLEYPLLVQEDAPGTGLMDVLIQGADGATDIDPYPVPDP